MRSKETVFDMVLRFVGDKPMFRDEIVSEIEKYKKRPQNADSVSRALSVASSHGLIERVNVTSQGKSWAWVVKQ